VTTNPAQPAGIDSERTVESVMKRVSRAQRLFELSSLRFIDCRASYDRTPDGEEHSLRIGIADQEVELDENVLSIRMRFEFRGPSPFEEEQDRLVDVTATVRVEYVRPEDRGDIDRSEADVFARVNGIYNAWPYLREFVQTSLVRLSLPPFELPLLRPGAAAQLAGLVDPPPDPDDEEPPRGES